VRDNGMSVKINCLDPNHPNAKDVLELPWRT